MTSAWDHYDSAERPPVAEASGDRAAVSHGPNHFSVRQGDILHLDDEAYVVTGSVSLGMPVREITLHLRPVS